MGENQWLCAEYCISTKSNKLKRTTIHLQERNLTQMWTHLHTLITDNSAKRSFFAMLSFIPISAELQR